MTTLVCEFGRTQEEKVDAALVKVVVDDASFESSDSCVSFVDVFE